MTKLVHLGSRSGRNASQRISLTGRLTFPPALGRTAVSGRPLLWFVFILLSGALTLAEEKSDSGQGSSEQPNASGSVEFGIGGHYRVGRVTAVRLAPEFRDRLESDQVNRHELVMETLDGDGVRVRYDPYPPVSRPLAEGPRELGYVVPGSEAAPLALRRSGEAIDEVLVETRFPLEGPANRGPAMIPSGMPWVLSIGDPLGVEQIGQSNVLLDKAARIAVTTIADAGDLPAQPLGLDGVDLIMFNATGLPILRQMNPDQTAALVAWLKQGGRFMICLGESAERFEEVAPWLTELLPIDQVEVSRYDPAAFETYTASQTPLKAFSGIKLPRRLGQPLLIGRTTRRVTAVLAADYSVGFGRVSVVAADLDAAMFAEWPERLDLVTQVAGGLFDEDSGTKDKRDGSTVFSDLAGQMRGVLDQFPVKRSFGFALLSLIVMILIAVIGPLDYLLINRVLGKPLLGWITFPLFIIALSVFLVSQASPEASGRAATSSAVAETEAPVGGPLLRSNQFQVVDLDLIDRVGRGFAWSYLYSHDPAEVSVHLLPDDWLKGLGSAARMPKTFSYPMGHPGSNFGGIQIAGENSVLSPYSVRPYLFGKIVREGVGTSVQNVTIAPRSSKSIASRTGFVLDEDAMQAEVTRRPGSELLRGEFKNPLPFDLLDGVLVYGNWVYTLPTRVPSGATVPSLSQLRQKNFRWRLTRQQRGEKSRTETTPWSPNDFSDPDRVAEIMLFHGAAGGSLYTGLTHEPLSSLDLSDLLTDDRCILVGRTESPLYEFKVRGASEDLNAARVPDGEVLSIIRVVLPVRTTRLN